MNSMKVSPTLCPECGHRFQPGAPEPSWCPDCGKLCSAYDVPDDPPEPPEPDEIPETAQDKRRMWVWFWMLFLGGPLTAGLGLLFAGNTASWVPRAMNPFGPTGTEPFLALFVGAGGAGFCLAKIQYPRRALSAQLVLAFAMACGLFLAYAAIGVLIVAMIHMLFNMIPG